MKTKTVLITGASRGIGRAAALMFHENGYNVVANYNNTDPNDLKRLGIFCVKGDVSDFSQVENMFNAANDKFGGVDVIVNNAGVALQKMLCDTTPSEWDGIFDINIKGMYNTVKCAADYMVNQKYGKIINVSSMWGITGASCEVAYSASKAAVIGFTKALAKELGPSNICVNCVAPGVIDTDMNKNLNDETKEILADETPLCRLGTETEVADTIYFLASDKSDFITGQVISVNGGIVI